MTSNAKNTKTQPSATDTAHSVWTTFQQYLAASFGLVLWFLFLFSGGVVFAVYYARHGYLPDLELNSALSYLAAASIIGGGLVISLTLLVIVPGFIWAKHMTTHPDLKGAFCDDNVISPLKFLVRIIFPFFLFVAVMHWFERTPNHPEILFLFIPIAIAKGVCIRRWEVPECKKDGSQEKKPRLFFLSAFWYGVSVFSGLIASFTLFKLLSPTAPGNSLDHFLICTVGVVVANTIVIILVHEGHEAGAIAAGLVLALALIALTDRYDRVPDKILSNFGFGQENVRLVVTDDGYNALRAAGVPNLEDKTPGPKAVFGVKMLCRMGPNYFLRIGETNLSLQKSSVISWAVDQHQKTATVASK